MSSSRLGIIDFNQKENAGRARRDMLREQRRLRAARDLERRQKAAAVKMQATLRSYNSRRSLKLARRKEWDQSLRSSLSHAAKQRSLLPSEVLGSLIRELLFFYNSATDKSRLMLVSTLLVKSLLSAPETNHAALISKPQDVWLAQAKKLALHVLPLITSSSAKISLPALTLLRLLTDSSRWPITKTFDDATRHRAEKHTTTLMRTLLQSGLYPQLRAALLSLTFLGDTAEPIASRKERLSLVVLLAFRPLSLLGNDGSSATSSSASSSSTSAMDISSTDESSLSPTGSFVAHVLSIPLLHERLATFDAAEMFSRLLSETLWLNSLDALTSHDVNVELCVEEASHSSHDITEFAVLSRRARRRKRLRGQGGAAGGGGDAAASSSSSSSSSSLAPPFNSAASNGSAAGRAVSVVKGSEVMVDSDSDSESDYDDTESKMAPSESSTSANANGTNTMTPSPLPSSAWLLGNVLRIGAASGFIKSNLTPFLTAVNSLLSLVPDSCFPSKRDRDVSAPLHPKFISQLNLLTDADTLNTLCADLTEHAGNLKRIFAVSSTIVTLLNRWPDFEPQILNKLAFSTNIVSQLWSSLAASKDFKLLHSREYPELSIPLSLMCMCYSHVLKVQDDQEFFVDQKPLSLATVTQLTQYLKDLLFRLYWDHSQAASQSSSRLRFVVTQCFKRLRARQSRKHFCHPDVWLMEKLPLRTFEVEAMQNILRARELLSEIPFVLPFDQRVRFFYAFINEDKEVMEEGRFGQAPVSFMPGRGVQVQIRRPYVLRDGFARLAGLGSRLKGLVQIEFIDEHGIVESGIDGGGLYKEFLTELTVAAYDPKYGLFKETPDNVLYPNPGSDIHSEHLAFFEFLGMMLGKAMYDGILVETRFANFFLHKLLHQHNYNTVTEFLHKLFHQHNYIDDLSSFDNELYKNLISLKRMPDEYVESLALTFSASSESFGVSKAVNLIRNGVNTPVTAENRTQFIHRLADYRLNREIRKQSAAFLKGMGAIVKPEWIRMFSGDELQQLISGSQAMDVQNLRDHTNYGGGYGPGHELVKWFWQIVDEMSERDRSELLKFATSCSRAPLLGFQAMNPKFCIHRSSNDSEALPTAATCMNLLRIPRYYSKEKLRDKLRYAMSAGGGFQMT